MKTLLRYPGGKSRAVKILKPFIPKDIKEIASPFFGGGSLELSLANDGIYVHGYDSFSPLVDFWETVIDNPEELAEAVGKLHPMEKGVFYAMQKEQEESNSKIKRAAAFYALNRSSFSGSTLSGGMSPGHPRFNQNAIDRVKNFAASNLSVKKMDFKESIASHPETFLYCDPPYAIDHFLYGKNGDKHKDFDHEGLATILKKRTGWALSYNDSEYIKELYAGFDFVYPEWAYGMNKDKKSKEILILNY